MCKLFGICEVENKKNAEMFTKNVIPSVVKTDNHGLGIMRLGENGVHMQRWLEPPTLVRTKKSTALLRYEAALKHQQNEAGRKSRELYAIAVHGRFATCTRSLQNTHPFYRNGSALMHNGVIPNANQFTQVLSTCDSEALLSQYVEMGVRNDPTRLTEALKNVHGYYAAIVFNDNGIVDIWRDETASLFLAHVRGVGVVFATTEEIIVTAAKKSKAYITGMDEILPYTAIRWTQGISPQISTFESDKVEALPAVVISSADETAWKKDEWWRQEEDRNHKRPMTEEEIIEEWQLTQLKTEGALPPDYRDEQYD